MDFNGLLPRRKRTKYRENIGGNEGTADLTAGNTYSKPSGKRRRSLPKYLITEEIDALLRTIKSQRNFQRDLAIFTLAYQHGLRASEIGMIQMRDYSPGRRPENDDMVIERLKGSDRR
jgi:integrase